MVLRLAMVAARPTALCVAGLLLAGDAWTADLGVAALVAASGVLSGWIVWRADVTEAERRQAMIDSVRTREEQAQGRLAVANAELERLRSDRADPRVEARRLRLRHVGATVTLTVGDRRVTAPLRDLSLRDVWVELPPWEASAWVPGLPVQVEVSVDGGAHALGWATAERSLASASATVAWQLRWQRPLREGELPRALWRAVIHRDAHRVRGGDAVRAVLHTPDGPITADVVDISATGVGIVVKLDANGVGRLPPRLFLSLSLPDQPDGLAMTCRVRHMDVRGAEAHLGLCFADDTDHFAEIQPRIASQVIRMEGQQIAVKRELRLVV